MVKWLHHLLNPHCEHCMEEAREKRVCNSCEVLKMECARLQIENDKLLNRILEKPTPEPVVTQTEPLRPLSGPVPWKVRQQLLEAEDRAKAKSLQANKTVSTEELENELNNAATARENSSSN